MSIVELKNWFTFDWRAGSELLDATIIDTVDQNDLVSDYKETKRILWFVKQPIFSKDQTFSSKYAWGGLSKKEEMEIKKLREMTFWPKKGIYIEEFSEKFFLTKLLSKWLNHSNTIKWASESVQADFLKVPAQIKDLYKAYDITTSDVLAKVITEGFEITTAEGPGSPTPKWQPLFSSSHKIKNWNWEDETFSNLYWATIDYDNADEMAALKSWKNFLQKALDSLKSYKLDWGRKIKMPKKWFKLICSREREVFWKKVINDWKNSSVFATHEGVVNQFTFNWNLISIEVLDNLWDFDKILNKNIWNINMAFVTNPDYLETAEALKYYTLSSPEIKNWSDDDADVIYTSLTCDLWADHYDAELWIYWYKWA